MQCCPNCGISLTRYEAQTFGNVTIDENGEIIYQGQQVRLPLAMRKMCAAMIRAGGRTMTREALLNAIDLDYDAFERTVDVYIKRIRKAFSAIDPAFNQIKTDHRVGYRWERREPAPLRLVA